MVSYDFHKLRNPRDKRLATEHINVAEICAKSKKLSYEVIGEWGPRKPPEAYRITYHVKSIIGIDQNQQPQYGDRHVVEIRLPQGYPMTATARCRMLTDIWHPNIKSKGQFKGRICSNSKSFGKLYQLDDLILRIGEIIQYKNYHAVNTAPFPEDEEVARWVREVAEPQGWVNRGPGGAVDESHLLDAVAAALDNMAPQGEATSSRQSQEEESSPPPEEKEADTGIKIKPKGITIRPR
ncbi:MAG: hypothetical protein D6730_14680 [Bacteroidetes bacterium]|nr:MAG: hypothetical protein D6730_14680 [Bacteroidota bacterium]